MQTLLTTIHGSRLYGLARPDSDIDYFRVVRGVASTQKITGNDDIITVEFEDFLVNLAKGSPQAWEALWSPVAQYDPNWEPYFRALRPTTAIYEVFRRTIKAFDNGDTVKRRRHGRRLRVYLDGLETIGRFNPRLTEEQIEYVLGAV